MLHSMTAFASGKGAFGGFSWAWELRSVNGKGLDLRLRVPDWIEGLEAALREKLGKAVARGNVALTLRVQADAQGERLAVNQAQLDGVLQAMMTVTLRAQERGVVLAPASASDLLSLRGVLDAGEAPADTGPLRQAILADADGLLADFLRMRAREGQALEEILRARLDEIAHLVGEAADAAEARRDEAAANLRRQVARILDAGDGIDEARLAQELALLAVKSDVTEEIDRLRAHVGAARGLVAAGSPMGRKLDFLSQEFNREANTLCAKAQSAGLTALGLALKTAIDQMREQVQNVE